MSTSLTSLALAAVVLVTTLPAAPVLAGSGPLASHLQELKQVQVRRMQGGARRKARRPVTKAEAWSRMRERVLETVRTGHAVRRVPVGERQRRVTQSREELAALGGNAAGAIDRTRVAEPQRAQAIAVNTIVNNRATDTALCPLPCSGQAEISIAAHNNNLVAAWNDGEGFVSGDDIQGYAVSTDGGLSWTDLGEPPNTVVGSWVSDPVVAVNEKTGEFYYTGLIEPTVSTNGVGIVKGSFVGGVFSWGTPVIVRSAPYTSFIFDKQWVAVDSLSSNVYVVYASFSVVGGVVVSNQIDFQRSTNGGANWGSALKVSSSADNGLVQGARVVVGPGTTPPVYATWSAIGLGGTGEDFMRVRKSTTSGASFAAEFTAIAYFQNFGNGAPGFNRGIGLGFPAIAVDRSTGANRGRVYLGWNESVNFYDDDLGFANSVIESEQNGSPGQADVFSPGDVFSGTIGSQTDNDWWRFTGTRGQTAIFYLDTLTTTDLNCGMRLYCSNGATELSFSESGEGGGDFAQGLIVFTFPEDGTYYLRFHPLQNSQGNLRTGGYRVQTGLNSPGPERGRDHRDVFVRYSNDGVSWTAAPTRVNDDPGYFDNWLPELAVASNGKPYAAWYDFRDQPCGAASNIFIARSETAGADWTGNSPVTDDTSPWSQVESNIAPNQGDYISLFANQNGVYAAWADGRNLDPDIFTAVIPLDYTAVLASLASAEVAPDRVTLTWHAPRGANLLATVYRRQGEEAWRALGSATADGTGMFRFTDLQVQAGTQYVYRLGIVDEGVESFSGEIVIDVPRALSAFAIHGAHPNPSTGPVWVTLSLASSTSARLELLDVHGRRVAERELSSLGSGRHVVRFDPPGGLAAGVYMFRLTQAGRIATGRVTLMR